MVSLLLAAGADATITSQHGATPLFMAADAGHEDVVEALLSDSRGASVVNVVDAAGFSALSTACMKGHLACVERLLKAGAALCSLPGMRGPPLLKAAQGGHMRIFELLLQSGATVDEPCADKSQVTALYMAAQLDNPPMVQMCLQFGADPDSTNARTGSTALLFAAERGYLQVCKLLVAAGADVNAANR